MKNKEQEHLDSMKLLIRIIIREALSQRRRGGSADEIEENIINEYLKSQV